MALFIAAVGAVLLSAQTTTTDFKESDDTFSTNPGRGWYLPLDTATNILAKTTAADFSTDGVESNLVRYLVVLADSCNTESITAIETEVTGVLQHLASLGKRAVLRPMYSTLDGFANTCGDYYPASLSLAEAHIEKLTDIINENPTAVAFVEAGVLGAWGEWHGWGNSGFKDSTLMSSKANRAAIVKKYLDELWDVPVVVRRPVFKLESDGKTDDKVGMHNDCFLTTWNAHEIDMYTFSADYGGFTYGYDTAGELYNYTKDASATIAMGGETCANVVNRFSCAEATAEMKALHYDYLNNGYYGPAIDMWELGGCFSDIEKYLGYRFLLTSASYTTTVKRGKTATVDLTFENVGWGKLMRAYAVEVALVHEDSDDWYGVGEELDLDSSSNTDLSTYLAGQTKTASFTFEAPDVKGSYAVHVYLTDPWDWRPTYAIKLASVRTSGASMWNGDAHVIGATIIVN